jgi:hypothetical protein
VPHLQKTREARISDLQSRIVSLRADLLKAGGIIKDLSKKLEEATLAAASLKHQLEKAKAAGFIPDEEEAEDDRDQSSTV